MMTPLGIAVVSVICLLFLSWILDRFVNPALDRRKLKKLIERLKKNPVDPRTFEKPENGTIHADSSRLRITNMKRQTAELRWSEVEEVHAFKRDLFSVDLICLAFKRVGIDEYYEIDEDMKGYRDLLEFLPKCLPGFTSEWYSDVAFPAFESKHQIVWKKTDTQNTT